MPHGFFNAGMHLIQNTRSKFNYTIYFETSSMKNQIEHGKKPQEDTIGKVIAHSRKEWQRGKEKHDDQSFNFQKSNQILVIMVIKSSLMTQCTSSSFNILLLKPCLYIFIVNLHPSWGLSSDRSGRKINPIR